MQLGTLIKSNNKIENRNITFSYAWNLLSKFMVWLENKCEFAAKKAEKRPLFAESCLEFESFYQWILCLDMMYKLFQF